MAQVFDPLPSSHSDFIVCCYVNATSKIQVARVTNIPNWYFERVVFPGQQLVFESDPQAQLEIHTGMMASAILSDTIPCNRLQISDISEHLSPDAQQRIEERNDGLDQSPNSLEHPWEVTLNNAANLSSPKAS
nr:DUF1830 domain-containing protein [Petrachloros mirabilis]